MTISDLYQLLLPLINFLGVISLIVLVSAGTLCMIAWIIRKLWKVILTLSALLFLLIIVLSL